MRSALYRCAALIGLCACADAAMPGVEAPTLPQPEPAVLHDVALIDNLHWQPFAASLDAWPEHQPEQIACEAPGWLVELERLEVNTGACNYALLEHPALAAAPSGSEVQLVLWHFDLTAPAPARAHIAIAFEDAAQWETYVDIPQPGNVQRIAFTTTRDLAPGDPIRVHLHNHGQNSWMLSGFRARVAR